MGWGGYTQLSKRCKQPTKQTNKQPPDYRASPDFFVGPIGLFEIWRSAKTLQDCKRLPWVHIIDCQVCQVVITKTLIFTPKKITNSFFAHNSPFYWIFFIKTFLVTFFCHKIFFFAPQLFVGNLVVAIFLTNFFFTKKFLDHFFLEVFVIRLFYWFFFFNFVF